MAHLLRLPLTVGIALIGGAMLLTSITGAQEDQTPVVVAHGTQFFGSVTLNGEPAPDGMSIEALVGDIVCGETTTTDGGYVIFVRVGFGVGSEFQEGCNGAEALFRSGDLIAAERGEIAGGFSQEQDLTFGDLPEVSGPPVFPDTGSGDSSGSGSDIPPWLLWALVLTGTVAVGAGAIATKGSAAMSP